MALAKDFQHLDLFFTANEVFGLSFFQKLVLSFLGIRPSSLHHVGFSFMQSKNQNTGHSQYLPFQEELPLACFCCSRSTYPGENPFIKKGNSTVLALEEVEHCISILPFTQILEELSEDPLPWPFIYKGVEREAIVPITDRYLICVIVQLARCLLSPKIRDKAPSTSSSVNIPSGGNKYTLLVLLPKQRHQCAHFSSRVLSNHSRPLEIRSTSRGVPCYVAPYNWGASQIYSPPSRRKSDVKNQEASQDSHNGILLSQHIKYTQNIAKKQNQITKKILY